MLMAEAKKESETKRGKEAKKTVVELLADIEKALPPIVFRNWQEWKNIIPISPRSVANDDSRHIGPKEKLYMGRVAGYPREAFMEYLRGKSRLA
jgi:hypothetical protein